MTQMQDSAQDAELGEHEGRLDQLEDRLATTFPTPATPVGAAQRFRFAVPTPATVLTLGARGSNTSRGQAIGPGGVAVQTVEDLAAEIQRDMILDVVGNLTLYSDGASRLLTQTELGVAAQDGVRVGTASGDVEVTAGQVVVHDPSFTVIPSMDVPPPAEVDTATPRSAAEAARSAWKAITITLKQAARLASVWDKVPNTPSSPSEAPEWASTIGRIVAQVSAKRALFDALVAPIMAQIAAEQGDSAAPKVRIHGAGGVAVTTPSKVGVFGQKGVSIDSTYKCSVSGGLKAGLYSPVAAQVYGMASAKLKSDVTATVSARHTVMKGQYAEVRGERVASLSSVDKVLVQSKGDVGVDAADSVAIGGQSVHVYGRQHLTLASRGVRVTGRETIDLGVGTRPTAERSRLRMSDADLRLEVESAQIRIQPSSLSLTAGGQMSLTMDSTHLRFGGCARFDVAANETVIRHRVRLG